MPAHSLTKPLCNDPLSLTKMQRQKAQRLESIDLGGFKLLIGSEWCDARESRMEPPSPRCLIRIDPVRNMARFYALSIEPSLFGDLALVQSWGRIGCTGHRRIRLFRSFDEALRQLEAIEAAKRNRGYITTSPRTSEQVLPSPGF